MTNAAFAEVTAIGIDIGKNTFHAIGLIRPGAIVLREKWSRRQLADRLANLPPCLIGLEASWVGTTWPGNAWRSARLIPGGAAPTCLLILRDFVP
jgi:hypothetical protein